MLSCSAVYILVHYAPLSLRDLWNFMLFGASSFAVMRPAPYDIRLLSEARLLIYVGASGCVTTVGKRSTIIGRFAGELVACPERPCSLLCSCILRLHKTKSHNYNLTEL